MKSQSNGAIPVGFYRSCVIFSWVIFESESVNIMGDDPYNQRIRDVI